MIRDHRLRTRCSRQSRVVSICFPRRCRRVRRRRTQIGWAGRGRIGQKLGSHPPSIHGTQAAAGQGGDSYKCFGVISSRDSRKNDAFSSSGAWKQSIGATDKTIGKQAKPLVNSVVKVNQVSGYFWKGVPCRCLGECCNQRSRGHSKPSLSKCTDSSWHIHSRRDKCPVCPVAGLTSRAV